MVNDMLDEYDLKGWSRDQVLELLGEPDSEYSDRITYYLGMTGIGVDSGTLGIHFTSDSLVISTKIWSG